MYPSTLVKLTVKKIYQLLVYKEDKEIMALHLEMQICTNNKQWFTNFIMVFSLILQFQNIIVGEMELDFPLLATIRSSSPS